MSQSSEKESEREEGGEISEDFELVDNPDENESDSDDGGDLQPIEPYKDIGTITEPLHDSNEPTDIASSRGIQNRELNINNEESVAETNNNCESGENETATFGDTENSREDRTCVQITPEMIVVSLKRLHYLKRLLTFEEITCFINRHYPVEINIEKLKDELAQKIRIACDLGFVREEDGKYRLTSDREKLYLGKSDLAKFWESYLRNPGNVEELKSKSSEKEPLRSECVKDKNKRKYESRTESTAASGSKRRKHASDADTSSRSSSLEDVPTCSYDTEDDYSTSSQEDDTGSGFSSSEE